MSNYGSAARDITAVSMSHAVEVARSIGSEDYSVDKNSTILLLGDAEYSLFPMNIIQIELDPFSPVFEGIIS